MVPALALDSFSVLVIVGIVGGVGALMLLGIVTPGTGAEQIDWRPTRSPEVEAENELDDVAQMLAATNARRRRKGLDDLTEDDLALRVARDQREQRERRERHAAEAPPDVPVPSPDGQRVETREEVEDDAAALEALVRRKREARLAREAERDAAASSRPPGVEGSRPPDVDGDAPRGRGTPG